MKIALGQVNPTVGDIDGNAAKILEFAERARLAGASLIIFPELSICGYPPLDLLLKESFVRANARALNKIKVSLKGISAIVGFVDTNSGDGRPLFNAAAVLSAGKVVAVQYKTLLPTYDVFDEDRYFQPASTYTTCNLEGIDFGLSICEDIWNYKQFSENPRYQLDPLEKICALKPQVLVNISASPFSLGREHIRHDLVRSQAVKHDLPIIYVNQVGGNDQLIFDGRSIAFNRDGSLAARASAFEEDLVLVDVSNARPKKNQTEPKNQTKPKYQKELKNQKETKKPVHISGEIKESPEDRAANFTQALVLGTRDYVRKCGFKKAVIGLSGGIDSALTCALAVEAIGAENVMGVAMPSPYSSESSLADAEALARNLGIAYQVIPIETAMGSLDQTLAPSFAGTISDTTEENIQARLRGLILMALSNKFGYLVLTTGNKSELAVGYCTIYGDMCGGLAVISDLPKTSVYEVARYINDRAGREIIPRQTIEKAPSAELRPNQRDQDSLPPYVVLDGIIHAYVEQRRNPDEIVRLGYRPEVVMDIIAKIDRNEYKRNQAAPGLRVTTRAFGLGWRMPIAHKFRESMSGKPFSQAKVIC